MFKYNIVVNEILTLELIIIKNYAAQTPPQRSHEIRMLRTRALCVAFNKIILDFSVVDAS